MEKWFVIGIVFGWFFTMTAFVVGAYAIFKTKREPHEGFFQVRPAKGEAFNLPDALEDEDRELPPLLKKMNLRFRKQNVQNEEAVNE